MPSGSFLKEKQKLFGVLAQIKKQENKLKAIPRYYGDDVVEQALDHQRQSDLKKLKLASNEPYFGRVDFQEAGTDHAISLYIGKVGISDERSTHLLVIDWRAPISSMFYRFTGQEEETSYDAPEGEVRGIIHLKRNIAIRQQILQRVVDSYVRGEVSLGAADEFLLHRLGENKDNRLRDIVSTIQVEQDRIIRAELDKVLIIQGVPGSGKTTVALHRLAYLLYQHQQSLSPERMIIFAPNNMFLDYISSVLPELGVDHIQQTTFLEWALEILASEKITLTSNPHVIPKGLQEWIYYKGSIQFYTLLQSVLKQYEESSAPKKSFVLWEEKEISKDELQTWYRKEYRHYPLEQRKERILARMKRWIESEHKEIRELDSQGQLKKKALTRLRSYAKSWAESSLFDVYKKLLKSAIFFAEEKDVHYLTFAIEKLRRNEVELEDIPPLLMIYYYIYGSAKRISFEHVVIDEAQDFSPFQVMVVKQFASNSSFTILGDLLQNIYQRGISSWDQLATLFVKEDVQYHELDISYRSTEEIIYFANDIVAPYMKDISLAKPIYRSGNPVQIVRYDCFDKIVEVINDLLSSNTSTIAVITKTEETSHSVYASLQHSGISSHMVTSSQAEYLGGITVTSISLVKGMEFDAVLLLDVDSKHYPKTELNAKLLYVGCTRALHHLYIFSSSELSPLIHSQPPSNSII